ncbi:MAG: LysM peptidoglycan-binding domain-containing protein [Candidatus Pacebacteria bacterium]|nr:LysM peptidoglycan-binding domain-containing protein [Candidatus Paceibacterota bacterium]
MQKLNKFKLTTALSVFFLFLGIVGNLAFFGDVFGGDNYVKSSDFKRPYKFSGLAILSQDGTAFGSMDNISGIDPDTSNDSEAPTMEFFGTYLDNFNSKILSTYSGIGFNIYKISKGDNLKKIATNFGISTKDLLASNPELKNSILRVGAEITIPSKTEILEPEVKNLAIIKGYYDSPLKGNLSEINKNLNYVVVSSSCGTNVIGSADGVVTNISSGNYLKKDLGNFLEIEHTNGTKTVYGYLKNIKVSLGDFISRRTKIGEVGTSVGNSSCALYFEIQGAKNIYIK